MKLQTCLTQRVLPLIVLTALCIGSLFGLWRGISAELRPAFCKRASSTALPWSLLDMFIYLCIGGVIPGRPGSAPAHRR